MKNEYCSLTDKEVRLIASTPSNECEICDYIINNIIFKDNTLGYYVDADLLDDVYIIHIEQIINRKLN